MKTEDKFYLGLLLIVIGVIANSLYYYYFFQGLMITGIIGMFIAASASPIPLIIYFGVGGRLVYKNRPKYWTTPKKEKRRRTI